MALAGLLVLGAPWRVGADAVTPMPEAGSRVRITAPSLNARPVVGTLRDRSADAFLVAREDAAVVRVPFGGITRLEVSTRRKRHVLEGAAAGAAIGVAFALIGSRCRHPGFCEDQALVRDVGLVVFGGGGTGLGALIGAAVRTERWTEVALPAVQERRGLQQNMRP